LQQEPYNVFHHTLHVLLHYFRKWKMVNCGKLRRKYNENFVIFSLTHMQMLLDQQLLTCILYNIL